jgi:flagellar P-ring protein precursor FlgI
MSSSMVQTGFRTQSFKKNLLSSAGMLVCALALLLAASVAHAERLRDMASFQGVRENQLVGYGLVVGLDGSGDQTTQTPFTVQSVVSMLQQLGVNLPATSTGLQLKNVAAVMVTASLPAFAQPGQTLPVTVSSLGNAKSLRGGTLVLAPLKGADGQIYAMAQGNLVVGGVGAAAAGSKVQVNHLSVGLINNGATVERAVPSAITQGDSIDMELNESNFATASRVANAVNQKYGFGTATALDARVIRIRAPMSSGDRVQFIGALEDIDVQPAWVRAKVILNARTGSVVMNQAVTLDNCAVSHGNLTVVISADNSVSQPNAFSGGKTTQTQNAAISVEAAPGKVILLKGGTSLSDVVKALNSVGASPQDLLVILQAMKAAGALHADLDII